MVRTSLSLALAVAAFFAAAPAMADIFSYTDERGVVHFTNMPNGDKRFRLVRKEEGSRPAATQTAYAGQPVSGAQRVSQMFMPAKADILRYSSIIETASRDHGVDANLVHAVITAESGYNSKALSKAGASGLMQLMPETAKRYGVRNIWDPVENVQGGVRYLRDLIAMFNGNLELAIAAYNAGENAVIRHGHKIPPYAETVHYVPKVLGFYKRFQSRAGV